MGVFPVDCGLIGTTYLVWLFGFKVVGKLRNVNIYIYIYIFSAVARTNILHISPRTMSYPQDDFSKRLIHSIF